MSSNTTSTPVARAHYPSPQSRCLFDATTSGFPTTLIDWQPLDNLEMRNMFQLPDRDTGILITKVLTLPISPLGKPTDSALARLWNYMLPLHCCAAFWLLRTHPPCVHSLYYCWKLGL